MRGVVPSLTSFRSDFPEASSFLLQNPSASDLPSHRRGDVPPGPRFCPHRRQGPHGVCAPGSQNRGAGWGDGSLGFPSSPAWSLPEPPAAPTLHAGEGGTRQAAAAPAGNQATAVPVGRLPAPSPARRLGTPPGCRCYTHPVLSQPPGRVLDVGGKPLAAHELGAQAGPHRHAGSGSQNAAAGGVSPAGLQADRGEPAAAASTPRGRRAPERSPDTGGWHVNHPTAAPGASGCVSLRCHSRAREPDSACPTRDSWNERQSRVNTVKSFNRAKPQFHHL